MDQQKFWKSILARYVRGEAGPAEQKLLDRYFADASSQEDAVWEELEEAPETIRQRLLAEVQQGIRPPKKTSYILWNLAKGIAASLMLITGLAYFVLNDKGISLSSLFASEEVWQEYATQSGEQKQINLPDGSVVHLNHQSSLRFSQTSFGRQQRKVKLLGEAFFEVQKDSLRPFIVETEKLSTRVLGTSFNVHTVDGHYAVAVASGAVEVQAKVKGETQKLQLMPGQQASLDSLQTQLIFEEQVTEETFLWRKGILAFHADPMHKVVAELERAFGRAIDCEPDLLHRAITARYSQKTLDYILEDLCFLLGAAYEENQNQIRITTLQ
ncbi:FecR domain-containing protein [Porifericola rhodea]|uniref:FecR family protein n=1 Tax=Porifericola rhodea TaxID=930972 RepID=UPI002666C29C|nr:FecR domain-containing protein [Porifericola rhodea]WKN29571.1 FecR domain-containing protein [Porifericola rhodea]